MIQLRKNVLFMVVMAVFALFYVGCEGPAGPAGADGADGTDGADGRDGTDMTSAECLVCHSNDNLITIRAQLDQHDHATMANSLSRGGREGCGRCHSHENFVNFIETGFDENLDTVTGLTCESCHTLHNSDDATQFSYALVADGAVDLLTGGTGSLGKITNVASNLCVNCHQPRRDYTYYDTTPDIGTDNVSLTSSHTGPHYGMSYPILVGKGADARNSTVQLNQGPGTHAQVGCVPCHMGEGNTHTFKPDVDNCTSCHVGATNFDINGAETKIHDALHAIEVAFVALGALEDDGEGGFDQTASSSTPTVLTGAQYSAFWNYLILHSDHGFAIHNPKYVKAIINSIEAALGITATSW